MSDFYGRWADDYDNNNALGLSLVKYSERVQSFSLLAEETVIDITEKLPELDGKLFVCYQNIDLALGRYFNDIQRFKYLHKIKTVHPSKMIAHTVKWLHLNPVLFSSIKNSDFLKLSEEAQVVSININYSFIIQSVEYILSKFNRNISEAQYDHIVYNLQYYLKTGLYQERMAALWFEELIKG